MSVHAVNEIKIAPKAKTAKFSPKVMTYVHVHVYMKCYDYGTYDDHLSAKVTRFHEI